VWIVGRAAVLIGVIWAMAAAAAMRPSAHAQDVPPTSDKPLTTTGELALEQARLADQFARLEKLILRMAEFDRGGNPPRADLLKSAYRLGKDRRIHLQLEAVVQLLNQDKLNPAVDNQTRVAADLRALLDLLQTEDRADRLKSEQTRVRGYIKEIERLQRMQRSVQGRNEGGVDPSELEPEQERVADRTQALDQRIAENEGDRRQPAAGDTASPSSDDALPGTDDDGSQRAPDESPPPIEGEGTPEGDQSPAPSTPDAGEGESPPGNSDRSGPSESGAGDAFPGQQQIQEAERRMRAAEQKLAEAERSGALEHQKAAARNLAKAKAELEEILRQLREEEIGRTLAMLEVRFRKMMEMQLRVYEDTLKLDKRPPDERDRYVTIEAGKLSFQQRRIVMETDKCLTLLREEGSSAAFPETVEQMREDMQQVVDLLGQADVGRLTQGVEEDILQTLEELIAALEKAQRDQESPAPQMPQQQGGPGDQPLVDALAELKMIKALQTRINRRTTRYARLLGDLDDPAGQAHDAELISRLRELSEREGRLQSITHELSLGKNR
jgi:hypothetical protein